MLAHSHTCPSKDAPAVWKKVEFGVKDTSFHWRHWISLRSLTVLVGLMGEGVEDGVTRDSRPSGGKLIAPDVQEAITENQKFSPAVSQAFIRSVPSTCLCPGHLGNTVLLCFISGQPLGSKLQIFNNPGRHGPYSFLERRASQHCAWHHCISEKQLNDCTGACGLR